jgi:hypothetical protein
MRPSDTNADVQAAQDASWRRMSPAQRLDLALEMSNDLRALTRARLRREHPEWTDRELQIELFRLAFLPGPLPSWVR